MLLMMPNSRHFQCGGKSATIFQARGSSEHQRNGTLGHDHLWTREPEGSAIIIRYTYIHTYVVEALKRLKLMIASGLSLHHHVEPPRLALTLAACLILTSCFLKGSPNSGVTLIECIYHDSHKVCRCPSTPPRLVVPLLVCPTDGSGRITASCVGAPTYSETGLSRECLCRDGSATPSADGVAPKPSNSLRGVREKKRDHQPRRIQPPPTRLRPCGLSGVYSRPSQMGMGFLGSTNKGQRMNTLR